MDWITTVLAGVRFMKVKRMQPMPGNDLANTKGSNGRNSPNVLAFETEKSELADSGVPVQMQLFCNVKFMLMLNGFLLWIAENEVLGFKMNGS